MSNPDEHKQVSDAIIASAGFITKDVVRLYTTNKQDAEYLYNVVGSISADRDLTRMDENGIHREYYLQLAESDEHSIEDEDAFEWNTRPVWEVTFEPTDYFRQRALNWADEDQNMRAPRDFKATPLVCRIIYYAGAHEMAGGDGPYIEFEAKDLQKLDAELQNQDIHSANVDSLWRLDSDNSEKFRDYADIPEPDGGEYSDAEH